MSLRGDEQTRVGKERSPSHDQQLYQAITPGREGSVYPCVTFSRGFSTSKQYFLSLFKASTVLLMSRSLIPEGSAMNMKSRTLQLKPVEIFAEITKSRLKSRNLG